MTLKNPQGMPFLFGLTFGLGCGTFCVLALSAVLFGLAERISHNPWWLMGPSIAYWMALFFAFECETDQRVAPSSGERLRGIARLQLTNGMIAGGLTIWLPWGFYALRIQNQLHRSLPLLVVGMLLTVLVGSCAAQLLYRLVRALSRVSPD